MSFGGKFARRFPHARIRLNEPLDEASVNRRQ
jgi:hypothetical protein